MVRLGGNFNRRSRLADSPRPARKSPLEKSELEKRLLAQVPPGSSSAVRLERQKFKASPKPKELEAGYVYARACVPGDKIVAVDGDGDVVLEVVEVAPWMVTCLNIATGEPLGVLPNVIVQVSS